MSDWTEYTIDECAEILDHLRIPISEEVRNTDPGDTPYYGANGLQGFINGHIFDEDLILLAEDGGYFEEYQTRPVAYRISGKSWVNNHAHILRPRFGFDIGFLFYSLQHKNITPFIKGGTRAKLNQKELREIRLVAPVDDARRTKIGRVVSTIDRAIEQTEALIEKYQQVKAGLMHDLFTRGIGKDGKLRPPRSEAPDLYKQTPIGWMPKEWSPNRLGTKIAVIDPNPSHRYPDEAATGVPICSTENFLGDDDFDLDGAKYVPFHVYSDQNIRCRFTDTDVVFARKGKIGLARRYGNGAKVFSHTVVVMKPLETEIDPLWILWLSRSDWLMNGINKTMNSNLGVPTLGVDFIKKVVVPFPQESEQKLIAERLDSVTARISVEEKDLIKLKREKSGLMHDLLTGKVEVKIDAPEAAHV